MQTNTAKINSKHLLEGRGYRSLSSLLLLISIVMLASCGFHLRSYGESNANIHALSLDCPNTGNWELCHHLKQTLQLNNISVTNDAPLILVISPMEQTSRTLSLQQNASAAELGLLSEVTYKLVSADEDDIKHTQKVHVTNSYRHETSALLAKDRERDELQMQLSQQLAEMIVRQITILSIDQGDNRAPTSTIQ